MGFRLKAQLKFDDAGGAYEVFPLKSGLCYMLVWTSEISPLQILPLGISGFLGSTQLYSCNQN